MHVQCANIGHAGCLSLSLRSLVAYTVLVDIALICVPFTYVFVRPSPMMGDISSTTPSPSVSRCGTFILKIPHELLGLSDYGVAAGRICHALQTQW